MNVEFPNNQIIHNNEGRFKSTYFSNSYNLTLDLIYLPKVIQVTITFNSAIGDKIKNFNCPYNSAQVYDEVFGKLKEMLSA